MKWKYKVVRYDNLYDRASALEDKLNNIGDDAWELVLVMDDMMIFKKDIQL